MPIFRQSPRRGSENRPVNRPTNRHWDPFTVDSLRELTTEFPFMSFLPNCQMPLHSGQLRRYVIGHSLNFLSWPDLRHPDRDSQVRNWYTGSMSGFFYYVAAVTSEGRVIISVPDRHTLVQALSRHPGDMLAKATYLVRVLLIDSYGGRATHINAHPTKGQLAAWLRH
jgi:hypothetical protein